MTHTSNAPARLKARRQSALQRREKDVAHWTSVDPSQTDVNVIRKLDKAREDVVNLYAKLGMKLVKT